MLKIKTILIGAFVATVLTLPVVADEMKIQEGQVVVMMTDGQMHVVKTPDKKLSDLLMQHGEAMPAGVMMMMHGGKMMIMGDKKMDDGKMMFDSIMKK